MTVNISPLRDAVLKDPEKFRIWMNGAVDNIQGAIGPRVQLLKFRDLTGTSVSLRVDSSPFTVGAVTVGNVQCTDSSSNTPAAAPWVLWRYETDGRLTITLNGLPATNKWQVTLVLTEDA